MWKKKIDKAIQNYVGMVIRKNTSNLLEMHNYCPAIARNILKIMI